MGANPAYSSRVPVWGLVVFPPLAVDLQLTPGYQQSLQVNATASAKTHSAAGECRGGKRHLVRVKLKCPQHPGCPCAEDLTLPTYPYAGKEKLPESQAWSDA